MLRYILSALYLAYSSTNALAVCASLVKGPMTVQVKKCIHLSPEKYFSSSDERFDFIKDLSPEDRSVLYQSYRGMYIQALVLQSRAIRSGLTSEKGALGGEKIFLFSNSKSYNCRQVLGHRLNIRMDEQCCEGGGEAPCLLDTTYFARKLSLLKNVSKAEKIRNDPEGQKILMLADRSLKLRRYDEAVRHYSRLKAQGKLDILGRYHMSYALRALDRCQEVAPLLKPVFETPVTHSLWVTQKATMKRSVFLYARCLAKLGKISQVSLVLDSFLANPVLYKQEIRNSLRHNDFGRIRTTKEFQNYVRSASKLVNRR